jgi:hypothetical protein
MFNYLILLLRKIDLNLIECQNFNLYYKLQNFQNIFIIFKIQHDDTIIFKM